MRFQAIIHTWYIESKGWRVIDLEADNAVDAKYEADAYCHRNFDTFRKMSAYIIQAQPPTDEQIERGAKALREFPIEFKSLPECDLATFGELAEAVLRAALQGEK